MSDGHSQLSRGATAQWEAQEVSKRDRKPKIYEFYGYLESMARFWRVAGVFPFTMKGPIAARRYDINKFHVAYSFLVFLVGLGSAVHEIIDPKSIFKDSSTDMATAVNMIRLSASVLCAILSNIWRVIRHKELSKTINKMGEQSITLQKMNGFVNESKTQIIRTFVWATHAIIALLISYRIYLGKTEFVSMVSIILMVARLSNLAIFVTLVGAVGMMFHSLNEKIKSVVMRANAASPKIILTSDDCAKNLRLISRAHLNLCKIGKRINRMFDAVMVINLVSAFIVISVTLYQILVEVQKNGEINTVRMISHILMVISYGSPIIIIVVVCNSTFRQGIYAGKLIYEIQVESTDCQLYGAVESFSLQLHHHKLEFNAGGFVPLNSNLLLMMAKSLTTNLVILIQFQQKMD